VLSLTCVVRGALEPVGRSTQHMRMRCCSAPADDAAQQPCL